MIFCIGCGKLLALGTIKDGSPTGTTLDNVIVQPVQDGVWVHCEGCYRANGCAKLFPDLAATQFKTVADFPVAAQETKDAWRARLALKIGVKVDDQALVAQFNQLGI